MRPRARNAKIDGDRGGRLIHLEHSPPAGGRYLIRPTRAPQQHACLSSHAASRRPIDDLDLLGLRAAIPFFPPVCWSSGNITIVALGLDSLADDMRRGGEGFKMSFERCSFVLALGWLAI